MNIIQYNIHKNNTKTNLKEIGSVGWTGFIWLRIKFNRGLSQTWHWTFRSDKRWISKYQHFKKFPASCISYYTTEVKFMTQHCFHIFTQNSNVWSHVGLIFFRFCQIYPSPHLFNYFLSSFATIFCHFVNCFLVYAINHKWNDSQPIYKPQSWKWSLPPLVHIHCMHQYYEWHPL